MYAHKYPHCAECTHRTVKSTICESWAWDNTENGRIITESYGEGDLSIHIKYSASNYVIAFYCATKCFHSSCARHESTGRGDWKGQWMASWLTSWHANIWLPDRQISPGADMSSLREALRLLQIVILNFRTHVLLLVHISDIYQLSKLANLSFTSALFLSTFDFTVSFSV